MFPFVRLRPVKAFYNSWSWQSQNDLSCWRIVSAGLEFSGIFQFFRGHWNDQRSDGIGSSSISFQSIGNEFVLWPIWKCHSCANQVSNDIFIKSNPGRILLKIGLFMFKPTFVFQSKCRQLQWVSRNDYSTSFDSDPIFNHETRRHSFRFIWLSAAKVQFMEQVS